MKGYGRILLLMVLFLSILVNMQLSRMGIMTGAESFVNQPGGTVSQAAAGGVTAGEAMATTNMPFAQPLVLPAVEADKVIFTKDIKNKVRYLIIYDEESALSMRICSNYANLLRLYKLKYVIAAAQSLKSDFLAGMSDYTGIIIAVDKYSSIADYGAIFNYAGSGGSVLFTCPGEGEGTYNSIMSAFGITDAHDGGAADYIIDIKGIVGMAGAEYANTGMVDYRRKIWLRKECDVYLKTEDAVPLLWRVPYGAGNLYTVNSGIIQEPTGRGVVSGLLSEMQGGISLYPVFGLVTAHLESFPGPPIIGDYRILREIRKNYEGFAKDVLWPDMLSLARKFNLKFTLSYVQSYDVFKDGKLPENELTESMLMIYGSEVLKNGGELASHGYTYRPLCLEGELLDKGWAIPWPDMESMAGSISASLDFSRGIFPKYDIRVYFPPEGRMGAAARKNFGVLFEGFDVICVPYHNNLGDQLEGDFLAGRDGVLQYAITSGIVAAVWNAANSAYSLGIVSQSIDIPYAVIIDYRSWKQLTKDIADAFVSLTG